MTPSLIKLLVLFTAVSVALANPWPPSIQDSCNWLKAWCSECQITSCGNITSYKQQKLCFKTHCESHHPHDFPPPCKQMQMADKCMRSCHTWWQRSDNLTLSFMNEHKCRHCCDMQGGLTDKRMRRSGY